VTSAGGGRRPWRRRFLTVLILTARRPRFRKLRLSYAFVGAGSALSVALLATGLWAPRLLVRVRDQAVLLERLEHENHALRGERGQFETALAEMAERLGSFEERVAQLAEGLGMTDVPAVKAAAGGAALEHGLDRFWFDAELRAFRSRSESLDRSFDVLGDAFAERKHRLAATPSIMPVRGLFSHGYGWRKDPFTGDREFHAGIDIVAPPNTEIVAPADGVVSRAGRLSDYGKSLDVAHGHGFVTRYGHLNAILVQPGDRVRRGEVIGRVGSTGRSTGPHLHYEVFRDGRRVNPWSFLGQNGR
jgi:murein DD-endopeptidase MepM/ murein hydrolase activator NlpD